MASFWHKCNPQITPISYSVSNVTLASEWLQTGGNFEDTNICKLNFGFSQRLSGQFEAIWGSVAEKFFIYGTPRDLNIYPISSLLISMYYFVSTFIDSSGA